jgi:hypothetical protein
MRRQRDNPGMGQGELTAYEIGRALAQPKRSTRIHRREVHQPNGEVLIEEFIEIEE